MQNKLIYEKYFNYKLSLESDTKNKKISDSNGTSTKLIVNKHKQVKLKVVPIIFLCFFKVNILVNYLISQTEQKVP
jgi:hypothetical protein